MVLRRSWYMFGQSPHSTSRPLTLIWAKRPLLIADSSTKETLLQGTLTQDSHYTKSLSASIFNCPWEIHQEGRLDLQLSRLVSLCRRMTRMTPGHIL